VALYNWQKPIAHMVTPMTKSTRITVQTEGANAEPAMPNVSANGKQRAGRRQLRDKL